MSEFSKKAVKKNPEETVGKRLAVRVHAAAFVGVNLFLMMINLLTGPSYWWFLWPLCSWGIGLTMHVASYLIWLAGVTSQSKRGLLHHVAAFITVNTYLVFVWWMSGSGFMWFLFPLFGWLIGLIMHSVTVQSKSGEMPWLDKKEELREPDSNQVISGKKEDMIICVYCGQEVVSNTETQARFCNHCGASL